MSDWEGKSSVEAIRARFERDVERFCRLESGQRSTMDAPVAMALITEAAVRSTQPIRRVLDVDCGAGNNTIALLRRLGAGAAAVDCDLLDLAGAMLARAQARVAGETRGQVRLIQADFRETALTEGAYDVILAAAVLHHLRDDGDWERAFAKLYRLLRPGGSSTRTPPSPPSAPCDNTLASAPTPPSPSPWEILALSEKGLQSTARGSSVAWNFWGGRGGAGGGGRAGPEGRCGG